MGFDQGSVSNRSLDNTHATPRLTGLWETGTRLRLHVAKALRRGADGEPPGRNDAAGAG